jgi:glycine cleavage system H protein
MNVAGCEFPEGLWYHVEHQVWAAVDEGSGVATVGITSMGIRLAGEIYMCRPKLVGVVVEQGRSVAVVELAKSIVSVKSPVSGVVIAVNEALASRPELVHEDPYGAGWIARVRLQAWPAESTALLRGDDAAGALQHMAWLNRLQGELGS